MTIIEKLMEELRNNPRRFRTTGGYERLIEALEDGHSHDSLKQILSEPSDIAGDLLWTVAELDTVEPFVSVALLHLSSEDKGTAAYAMEIVLRGGEGREDFRAVFDRLQVCDVAICEHAVRVLVAGGTQSVEKNTGTDRPRMECCPCRKTFRFNLSKRDRTSDHGHLPRSPGRGPCNCDFSV